MRPRSARRWSCWTRTSRRRRRRPRRFPAPARRAVDIGDTASVGAAMETIVRERGRVDILVCTPSINVRKAILDYTNEEFDRVVAVNLKGTFNVLKATGRIMAAQRGGSIVFFSSIRSAGGRARAVGLRDDQGGDRAVGARRRGGVRGLQRSRQRGRAGRGRNAADRADQGECGLVRAPTRTRAR